MITCPEPRAQPVRQHGSGRGQADHQNDETELALSVHRWVREYVTPRTLPGQVADEENWEKLKADDGISMLDTLNRAFSRPGMAP